MHTTRRARINPILLLLGVLFIPLTAHAGLLDQVQQLLSANITPDDESMAMLRNVLGDFLLDPFNSHGGGGGSGSVLGEMFKSFNMFIFTTAMIWFGYNSLASLAQTMHEGVVLGRRMSTVWMPIRVTFGAASLMPVFGGWAFCQALMVIATTLGIAGANSVVKAAIDGTAAFSVAVNPMGSVKQASQLHDVEAHVLLSAACTRATNQMNAEAQALRGVSATTTYAPLYVRTRDQIIMQFPNDNGATGCGTIELKFSPRGNGITNDISSVMGFRINGVNYDAIRSVSMDSHEKTLRQVYTQATTVIDGALSSASGSAQIQSAIQVLNSGYFGSYSKIFQAQLAQMTQSANATSNITAVNSQLTDRMKDGGWATLGIWYSVFAEVNEAMNEMLDPVVKFEDPKTSNSSLEDDLVSAIHGLIASAQSQAATTGLTNEVGNTSVGQYIFGGVLNAMAGSNATGASNTINPIIAFKNIGDNALTLAQTLYFATKAVEAIPGASLVKGALTSKIGQFAMKTTGIGGFVASIANDAGALLIPIAFILFATAATMAFYLPMLPFIQWFAALLHWFTSILESLVGSALWALAHFDSDGEGMGQRASYGYLYLLNNFARPIILSFAFFFASAGVTVMGTFLFKFFGAAIASAQGSSLTGLMSIIAYLVIFTMLGITLINSSFSVLLGMADRIIGWVGNTTSSAIGSDVESRINGVFIAAAKSGSGVLGPKLKLPGAAPLNKAVASTTGQGGQAGTMDGW